MKKKENPSGGSSEIVMLLVVGVGGYLAYNYLVSSGLWAQWFGGSATASGMPTTATIAAGIQSGAFVGAGSDAHGNVIVHQVSTGAYYAVNPTTGAVSAAAGPGTTSSPSTTTVPTTVPVSTVTPPPVAVTPALQSQLQSMANQFMTNTGAAGLNVDQWNFYYGQVTGNQVTSSQGEAIIQALGLTDASRGTLISVSQYLTALGSAGLSGLRGIVNVPNAGPIASPLPTQSFNRGFGGYKNGVKANTYVN